MTVFSEESEMEELQINLFRGKKCQNKDTQVSHSDLQTETV